MGGKLGYREGDLPITEQSSGRLLPLPFYPGLTEEEQETVIHNMEAFFSVNKTRKLFPAGDLVESA